MRFDTEKGGKMHANLIPIIGIVAGTIMVVLIVTVSSIATAVSKRGVNRKELQELKQDISQMKESIEDIREQLADIVIRLG